MTVHILSNNIDQKRPYCYQHDYYYIIFLYFEFVTNDIVLLLNVINVEDRKMSLVCFLANLSHGDECADKAIQK